ncbi:MAG: M48 family metalloprotease [Rhodospirillaceae bacterium]|nr:M48 family metalloprotease [Rhodospirillaceae bacterium]
MSYRRLFASFLVLLMLAVPGGAAHAQSSTPPSLIRDAEIESIIHGYAGPIFAAAGIDPEAVNIYIVNDNSLNAAVAGGQNLFLFTGLLMRADVPNQLIGVIAHETGHMAGGHIARSQNKLETASAELILAYILGIGAALATGDGAAGTAVMAAGQSMIVRNLLSYTRTQEAAADQAALSYLDATGQSSQGLADFMNILRQKEQLFGANYDPYLRSHPLTLERVDVAERHAMSSSYGTVVDPPERLAEHERMRAKLIGFLRELPDVLRDYPEGLETVAARYARAIGYYRANQLDKAFAELDSLIAEFPDDPYFLELKGQILYEHGRTEESREYYEASVAEAPTQTLLHLGLAQTLIALDKPELDREAVEQLTSVVVDEPRNTIAWRLLSIAYGRNGEPGMAALALAEMAAARGDRDEAKQKASAAQALLQNGTPSWLRAQDILLDIDRNEG